MNKYLFPAALLSLSILLGCGGGSHNGSAASSPATSLSYTNPSAPPQGWSLVKDARTTATHLVLNLMGPSDGTKYRGVGFTLQADPTLVKFAQFTDANGGKPTYYRNWETFSDRNADGIQDIPVALQAGGVNAGKLMVGIFQLKDNVLWGNLRGSSAKDCSAGVLQIAIDLDPKLEARPGPVPLLVIKARVIPEQVGTYETRKTVDIPLHVGALELK